LRARQACAGIFSFCGTDYPLQGSFFRLAILLLECLITRRHSRRDERAIGNSCENHFAHWRRIVDCNLDVVTRFACRCLRTCFLSFPRHLVSPCLVRPTSTRSHSPCFDIGRTGSRSVPRRFPIAAPSFRAGCTVCRVRTAHPRSAICIGQDRSQTIPLLDGVRIRQPVGGTWHLIKRRQLNSGSRLPAGLIRAGYPKLGWSEKTGRVPLMTTSCNRNHK
jgi:hypothetical protein